MKKKNIILVLIISLSIMVNAWATKAEFEAIKKIEEKETGKGAPEKVKRPAVRYGSSDSRDPFKTSFQDDACVPESEKAVAQVEAVSPPTHLLVQGLIWGTKLPQAIINNTVIKIGDTLEGALITDINQGGVKVLYQGAEFTLSAPMAQGPSNESGGEKCDASIR